MAGAWVIATAVDRLLKEVVPEPRPWLGIPALLQHGGGGKRDSFPSGHTAGAVALATAATLGRPRLGWVALPAAATLGYERIARGYHRKRDVFTGAAIGALAGFAAELFSWRRSHLLRA